MRGATSPLPNTSPWRGAQLSTVTNLPLLLPLPYFCSMLMNAVMWNFYFTGVACFNFHLL
jgi:hypothetical protein